MRTPAQQIILAYNRLRSARSGADGVYRDIEQLIMPSVDGANASASKTSGSNNIPVSTIPINAANLLGSSIYSYTFSSSARNFALTASDKDDQDQLQAWLQSAVDVLTKQIQTSNFATVYSSYCRVWGTFGTACATVDYVDGKLRFMHLPINGNIYFTRSYGEVNSVYRLLKLTAMEAKNLFGEDQLSDIQKEALVDISKSNEKFEFIHAVYENIDYKRGAINPKYFKFKSVYVDKKEKKVVKESGYRNMRFFISNFIDAHDGADTGIGAGHATLPAVREINTTEEQLNDAFAITARPPLVVENDDEVEFDDVVPNSILYTNGKVNTLNYNPRPEILLNRIAQLKEEIKTGFYNDVLMAALGENRSNVTATEVEVRENEKISALIPMVSNLRESFWSKMIETCLGLLIENGLITEPPIDTKNGFEIEYLSILDSQIKVLDAQKTIMALQGANQILAFGLQNPDLNKIAKTEKMAKQYLESHNVDYDLIVTDVERAEMKKAEQDAAMAQAQEQQNQMVAQAIKPVDLQKRNEDGSALDQMSQSGLI